MDKPHKFMLASMGLVLMMVLLVYAHSFDNGFHFDDFHTITDNPSIRSLSNVPSYFRDASTFSVLPANRTYRPIVSASLALDYHLGKGYQLFWFHLSTTIEFLILVWLVSLLASGLYKNTEPLPAAPWLAILASAWFGLHPAMAETVNYIIQRGDLFCTLGCVAALVLYMQWRGGRRYGVYLLPLIFALLCKPPAAVFPVLLFAYIALFEVSEEKRWRKAAIAVVPSLLVTAAALVLQSAMTPKTFAPSILSPSAYRLTQPFVWLRYFAELFLPLHLNVDSDLQPFTSLNAEAMLGLVFLAALLAGIWLSARSPRLKPLTYGLIWFVVTQLPTSAYALSEVENDHRMFFSFAGLIPGTVWALYLALQRVLGVRNMQRWRGAISAAVLLALCGYAYGTTVRNRVWHSEESLWWDDVQKSPHNGRGLMIYGLTQMEQGRFARALDYFTRATEFTPNYATLEINLGIVNGAMGHNAEAEQHFLRAIALAPSDDQTHAFYGRWLMERGRGSEGVAQYNLARQLNPARPLPVPSVAQAAVHPEEHAINESLACYTRGDYEGSIRAAQEALAINPQSAQAYNNIGASLARLGRWEEAAEDDRHALAIDASLQIARNNLAEALAHSQQTSGPPAPAAAFPALLARSLTLYQAKEYQASLQAATAAAKLEPGSAEAWNNIAAADASLRRWDAAIAAAQKAVALKPDFQLAKNNLAWALSEKQKSLVGGRP
ncbi:tetratricopeptide repeat protein [Bryocella elongata]|uniref:tetratricopeptide repeat protein n=1 Tax=Bryocella elongata TaxID=863522 RepID=UPI001358F621|nr:tetratricopeptide repeat protein [Bryocella elongata]